VGKTKCRGGSFRQKGRVPCVKGDWRQKSQGKVIFPIQGGATGKEGGNYFTTQTEKSEKGEKANAIKRLAGGVQDKETKKTHDGKVG